MPVWSPPTISPRNNERIVRTPRSYCPYYHPFYPSMIENRERHKERKETDYLRGSEGEEGRSKSREFKRSEGDDEELEYWCMAQCSWACLGQKKWHQRSVNGFFHQFIYCVWKVKTLNLTLGSKGDRQNGSFYLLNALKGHFLDYSTHFAF